MTQQEHLTTEQLSAFLDKQLSPQEQAFFDAHQQSCQRCQHALAELRRTVVLLHAMPKPELPRSFTLPARITPIQRVQATSPQVAPGQQRRTLNYTLRRTVRAVSTIAAAIGLIFILSGLLANVHLGVGGGSTATSASYGGTANGPSILPKEHAVTPNLAGTPAMNSHQTGTPVKPPVTSGATPISHNNVHTGGAVEPPSITLPPVLDLSQPAGRLSLGALLLLLSIVGILTTRRRRDTAH
ncbi:MAG: hypothetical protein NVS3B14_02440 [Ktedonobacteraceae bacterium]